ncbi:hypothetical protein PRUPE_1G087600 [Prunus persica]|uniref:Uncharacterized protein n=1 Tax=Prunus persica TaxID=3760 RepID=A0A251QUP4_PRUPE|nr:hypothetical protein PRUPE_1G087600 [Prunus persica]
MVSSNPINKSCSPGDVEQKPFPCLGLCNNRVLALSSLRSQCLLRFSYRLWLLVPRWHRFLVSSDFTLVTGSVWWYLSLRAPFFAVGLWCPSGFVFSFFPTSS